MPKFIDTDRWRLALGGVILLLLVNALFFPLAGAAGIALLSLVALAGGSLALAARRFRVSISPWVLDVLVLICIMAGTRQLFGKTWNASGFRIYDWGPHHANLKHLVDGLLTGHVPAWVQSVSTGDSPYELYPLAPYYLAAKAAILTHTTDLTLVLVRSAILVHGLAALGAALLARRIVPWPWAIAAGFAILYDVGSVWGGGVGGLLSLGVLHSALANAIWPFTLIAVLSALRRPRSWKSVCIWCLVALAVVCHPLGLLSAMATGGALLIVACLARDVPASRALVAALHVALGVALVAFVWMPLNARLLLYGVHFSLAGALPFDAFGHFVAQPVPEATLAPLVYAGYLGILVGALSRRAAPTLLASFAAILMTGYFDQLYVLLHLAPSPEVARFQALRLPSAAKISVYVCGVYILDVALAAVRRREPDRAGLVMGALLAVSALGVLRGGLPYFERLGAQLRGLSDREVPDRAGFNQLIAWAREQNNAARPEQYARLLHEDSGRSYLIYHLNAESGLPTLWVGPVSAFFLRERIEDSSPESLRRFNVRWAVRLGEPPSIGDPLRERRFGSYIVRELREWDGRFARVERGGGDVVVTRIDDERVDVLLRGTSEPALVALGMGYYPRWVAQHERRGALPVYAYPGIGGGKLCVVAAWLPPGRTMFTASGPLPSDANGRALSAFGALVALSIILVWSSLPKVRAPWLLFIARTKIWSKTHRAPLILAAGSTLAVGSFIVSMASAHRSARALEVGSALRGSASVEMRDADGRWQTCSYIWLEGAYQCPGLVLVQDTMADLLKDAPPSPPFAAPAINIATLGRAVDVRVRLKARLAGEYWAVTNGGAAAFTVSGNPEPMISELQTRYAFADAGGEQNIELAASVAPNRSLQIAFVRRDGVDPERGYPVAPEHCPFQWR